jgi:cysteine desulfurase / selenocysteine lyase
MNMNGMSTVEWCRCLIQARLKNDNCSGVFSTIVLVALTGLARIMSTTATTTTTTAGTSRVIHLNHAGASPCSTAVLDVVVNHLRLEQRIGGYAAQSLVQDSAAALCLYQSVADLLQASSSDEIALVESATVAWTRIFYAVAAHLAQQQKLRQPSSSNKVILVSEAEYAANLVAACRWAQTTPGWTVVEIPSARRTTGSTTTSTGKVDLSVLQDMLQGRYKLASSQGQQQEQLLLDPAQIAMVCVTTVPTNSGIVNPVEEIGRLISEYNNNNNNNNGSAFPRVFYLVDACQAAGQVPVHVQRIQCHALVGTGRKFLRGPRGTGFLYVHHSFVSDDATATSTLWPHHVDHAGAPVSAVPLPGVVQQPVEDRLQFALRLTAKRFEFWESSLANKLGLGIAVREALDIGIDSIAESIRGKAVDLYQRLEQLAVVEGRIGLLRLHHPPECGIVTFWVPGVPSSDLVKQLWDPDTAPRLGEKIQFELTVVPATSTPLDSSSTGVPDLIRASVSYTTTPGDIDLFCAKLRELILFAL